MFERFTNRARRVVVLAQEEARLLDHQYIGTEHILLGLVHEREGVAAKALRTLGLDLDAVRWHVEAIVGLGASTPEGHIPFTPRAKKVLELGLREALQLGHNYIGTEHILLGLIREGEGVGAQVLSELGADLSLVRHTVIQLLSGYEAPREQVVPARLSQLSAQTMAAGGCRLCGVDLRDARYSVRGRAGAICEDCIVAANQAIDHAAARGAAPGPVALPPRVQGDPPDERAVDEIVDALHTVFDGSAAPDQWQDALEDAEVLLPAGEEAARRFPGPRSVTVSSLRFVEHDACDVNFSVLGLPFGGHLRRDTGVWRVTRDTFAKVLDRGGISCPPREPDEPPGS